MKKLLDLLRSPKPTSRDLRVALDAIDVTSAEAEVSRLSDERAALLMDGDDRTLDALEARISSARRNVERAIILRGQTSAALLDAEGREATEALTAERGRIEAEATAVAKALRTQYPKLASELVALLNRLEAAETAVVKMNAKLLDAGRGDEALKEVETRAFPVGPHVWAPNVSLFSRVTLPEKPGISPGFNDRAETGGLVIQNPTAPPLEAWHSPVRAPGSVTSFVGTGELG